MWSYPYQCNKNNVVVHTTSHPLEIAGVEPCGNKHNLHD